MALGLRWAVVLIGFAFGWVSPGPERLALRIGRGLLLGGVAAGVLLLGGTVTGFVVAPGSGLAVVQNAAILAVLFAVGLWIGETVQGRFGRPHG